jgi:hypothetical protein
MVPPWVAEPYRLWSLLEMIEVAPLDFWSLIRGLTVPPLIARGGPTSSAPVPVNRALYGAFLKKVAKTLRQLELGDDAAAADLIEYKLRRRKKDDYPEAAALAEIEALRNSVRSELRAMKFVYIPHPDDGYFEKDGCFGYQVYELFPEAEQDIRNAGTSIAVGLHDAAVFYLMRVAELGLRRLARRLHVRLTSKGKACPIEDATWDQLAKACKAKIEKAHQKPAGPSRRKQLALYSDAADHCLFMKDIWRNYNSHTQKAYKRFEAMGCFERVRDFMQFMTVLEG